MSKVVFLDNQRTVTAQDLHEVSHCDYWLDILATRIRSIQDRMNAPGYQEQPRDLTALHYRQRAHQLVESRRAHLIRVDRSTRAA